MTTTEFTYDLDADGIEPDVDVVPDEEPELDDDHRFEADREAAAWPA